MPGAHIASATLQTRTIDPSKLVRISRYRTDEPYFGKSGGNRFDNPRKRFGTCYFGFSLECAFAETVLHDEIIDTDLGGFPLPRSELERYVLSFTGMPLTVAVLNGASLKKLGGDGSISTTLPYAIPQAWSLEIHRHKNAVDGFIYTSRHLNDQDALVLFSRAKKKITVDTIVPFHDIPGAHEVLNVFGVIPR